MNTNFARIEYKFHLSQKEFDTILPAIEARLAGDKTVQSIHYPIISEYWDNSGRDIYWERLRGLSERRKFRIRIYGTSDGAIPPAAFLEVKHKSSGRGVKRRLPWATTGIADVQQNLVACLALGLPDCPRHEQLVRQEILALVQQRKLQPARQIRYDRMAYEGGDAAEEFRVTFDSAIRCRTERRALRADCRDFPHMVSEQGVHIMEVKAHQTMPYWMRELIGRNHLVPRGFSKYGTSMEKYDPLLRGHATAPAQHVA